MEDGDKLMTVAAAKTAFEANTIVAMLADAGIEASAFDGAFSALPLQSRFTRVPVQVRARDLDAAKAALAEMRAAAADIDWESVDVGEREDALPLTEPGHVPWLARLGFWIAVVLTGGAILLAIGVLIFGL